MRSVAFLLLLFIAAACSQPRDLNPPDSQDPGKPTILIAMLKKSQTAYKQDLIASIRADYSARYNVRVLEVGKPKDLEGQEYAALVVMETLKAWLMFNRGLKQFAQLPDQSKTVYFVSSGDPKWKWKREGLKVVTGATMKAKAADKYPELKAALDSVLQ